MEGWSRKIYLKLRKPVEEDHCSLQERLLNALKDSGPFKQEKDAGIRIMEGWSRKIYLKLRKPVEEDHCSLQERLLNALKDSGPFKQEKDAGIRIPPSVLQEAGEICVQADWKVTACLGFDGWNWELLGLEPGNTEKEHYGLCADLGSTTIIMDLVDLSTGELVAEESIFNPQIAWGEDILTRIFYTKDQPENLWRKRAFSIRRLHGEKIFSQEFSIQRISRSTEKSCSVPRRTDSGS